jgi:hypothetical protein
MNSTLHFAKLFRTCWATATVAYVFIVFRWGFGVNVAWGTSRPNVGRSSAVLALACGSGIADCWALGNLAASQIAYRPMNYN